VEKIKNIIYFFQGSAETGNGISEMVCHVVEKKYILKVLPAFCAFQFFSLLREKTPAY
jgi:hypothetical protein